MILPEMRVERGPSDHWEGLPLTRTACDYDSDELDALFVRIFCMGLPPPALQRTLNQWGYRSFLGNLPGGQRRRVPSKDMRKRHPTRVHTCGNSPVIAASLMRRWPPIRVLLVA